MNETDFKWTNGTEILDECKKNLFDRCIFFAHSNSVLFSEFGK